MTAEAAGSAEMAGEDDSDEVNDHDLEQLQHILCEVEAFPTVLPQMDKVEAPKLTPMPQVEAEDVIGESVGEAKDASYGISIERSVMANTAASKRAPPREPMMPFQGTPRRETQPSGPIHATPFAHVGGDEPLADLDAGVGLIPSSRGTMTQRRVPSSTLKHRSQSRNRRCQSSHRQRARGQRT